MKGLGVTIGIALLCLSSAILGAWIFDRFLHENKHSLDADISVNPGMDAVESYRCPRHLKKSVQIMGVEDGYDRSNDEPGRYHEALEFSPRQIQIIKHELGGISTRNFDETGADKMLYESVIFPRLTYTSQIFFRLRKLPGSRNDSMSIIFLSAASDGIYNFEDAAYSSISISNFDVIANINDQDDLIISAPITRVKTKYGGSSHKSYEEFLQEYDNDIEAILYIGDDLQIDFGAIIHCESIEEERGTTFTEFPVSYFPKGRSYLHCTTGDTAQMCDPHRGDYNCDMSLPLACYKPGTRSVEGFIDPETLGHDQTFNPDVFIGGEVKLTDPVIGRSFVTRGDVNTYCAESFGSDWKALTFHEAGGSKVATWSNIPDETRVWIDVYGSPHANCWSEDLLESVND